MLKTLMNWMERSEFARYHLSQISNDPSFDPVFNILASRAAGGFHRLKKIGFTPSMILDVGAHSGTWAKEVLPIFPEAKFIMIEAQPSLEPRLKEVAAQTNGRARAVIAMLGPHEEPATSFYLADTGSSRFRELTSFPSKEVVLPMTRLDTVVGNTEKETILLKMDVQGGEIDVLAGASNTLRQVEVVLMEASIVAYNQGAPRFCEVIAEMDRLGFRLFDLWDLRRIGDFLAQVDAVFVRKGGLLEDEAQKTITSYGQGVA